MTKSTKKVSLESLSTDLDKLAITVAKGFERTATKDDLKDLESRLDKRLIKVEDGVTNLNARVGHVETQIEEINEKLIPVSEFDDLSGRVKYIERKLNIKSGR